ncbi:MAG: hypothetical protein IH591_06785 [Bacteroidales bacterium]|nr:hypothetical protein [Bacteroidales bacterium]
MRRLLFSSLSLVFILMSCSEISQKRDIEVVKNAKSDLGLGNSVVNEDIVKILAGIRGTVKWISFKPAEYEDNPNIMCVQVDITRNQETNNQISVQYLLNRETGVVKTNFLEVDGVDKSKFDFYLLLMELGIENL